MNTGFRVRWTNRAIKRLEQIGDHIASDSPRMAADVIQRIVSEAEQLTVHPSKGRTGRVTGTREWVVSGLPYIVAYRVRDGELQILTVMHGAQKWPQQL